MVGGSGRATLGLLLFCCALDVTAYTAVTSSARPAPRHAARRRPLLCAPQGPDSQRETTDNDSSLESTGAKSFGEYLLPYAGLVALAFVLASAAFTALVLLG